MVSHPTNNKFALSILKPSNSNIFYSDSNKRYEKVWNSIITTEKGCIIN